MAENGRVWNTGTMQVTGSILPAVIGCLPSDTNVIGVEPLGDNIYEVVLSSPDIPPPDADGTFPVVSLTSQMHFSSKDVLVQFQSIVQYVVSVSWTHLPEKVTYSWGRWPIPDKQVVALKQVLDESGEDGAAADITPILQYVNIVARERKVDITKETSWTPFIESITSVERDTLLLKFMNAWFGKPQGRKE